MSKKREVEGDEENVTSNTYTKKIKFTKQNALNEREFKDYLILNFAKLGEFDNVQNITGTKENKDTSNLLGNIDTNDNITDN